MDPKPVYTGGDVIRGEVAIGLNKDMAIKNISVTLQCIEFAEIVRGHNSNRIVYTEKLKHYELKQIVWPPDTLPTVESRTMALGKYVFQYALTLPPAGYPAPENYTLSATNYISWELKCHVDRASALKHDVRERRKIRFVPGRIPPWADSPEIPPHSLGSYRVPFKAHKEGYKSSFSSIFSNKDRVKMSVTATAQISPYGLLQWPQQPGFNLTLEPDFPDLAVVTWLKMALIVKRLVRVSGRTDVSTEQIHLRELSPKVTLGKSVTLEELLGRKVEEILSLKGLTGTFQSVHHALEYTIVFQLRLTSKYNDRHSSTRILKIPIILAPENPELSAQGTGLKPGPVGPPSGPPPGANGTAEYQSTESGPNTDDIRAGMETVSLQDTKA